jgi:hypothetical protein
MTLNTPTLTIQINPVGNTGKFTIEVSPTKEQSDEYRRYLLSPANRLPGAPRKRPVQQLF